MNTANIINAVAQFVVAGAAIGAVIVSLIISNRQIKENDTQMNKQIMESRRLATEERQHQSCPIIVPAEAIPNVQAIPDASVNPPRERYLYTSEAPPLKGNIAWALPFYSVPIKVSNIGTGPAFNVHCVLYGYETIYNYQFISWNNGPIGHGKDTTIDFRHPFSNELWLDRSDSIDGEHTIHYPSAGSNPNQAIACLTISYHDLFGNKLASIFDYTIYHQWVRVFVSTPSSPKIALDLKELNDQKKQKTTKPKTSQGF